MVFVVFMDVTTVGVLEDAFVVVTFFFGMVVVTLGVGLVEFPAVVIFVVRLL